MKKICSLILVVALVLSVSQAFTGCTKAEASDLMEGIKANTVDVTPDMEKGNQAATEFGVRLFQHNAESGKNTLISPLSVLYALTMTANGAKGETLEQMEQVLGLPIDEMNDYLYEYMNQLSDGKKNSLKTANSIWFVDREGFTPNQDFLQTNADYFHADLYKVPFNDGTLKEINHWVKEKTDDMIPEILDKIAQDAVMYLINAIAFEAKWEEPYEDHQIFDGTFTREDGTETDASFMRGSENRYLQDDLATGFIKDYQNGDYAFVAMLPNEGVTVEEYVASLKGEALQNMLENPEDTLVHTTIPQFETEFDTEMSKILKTMGMEIAFDMENADFSDMATSKEGNIFIGRVIHKTYIQVTKDGTKASAATAVEMRAEGAAEPEEAKEVYLNRPFVYMLIDRENNLPLFIGTMVDVSE